MSKNASASLQRTVAACEARLTVIGKFLRSQYNSLARHLKGKKNLLPNTLPTSRLTRQARTALLALAGFLLGQVNPHARQDVLDWYMAAYKAYRDDVRITAEQAATYAARTTSKGATPEQACPGGLGRFDGETLYLWVRARVPSLVLEMGPKCGHSTFWILQALEDNGHGELHSFDEGTQLQGFAPNWSPGQLELFERFTEFISPHDPIRGMARLRFQSGSVEHSVMRAGKPWDVVFINSEKENRLGLWHTTKLLPSLKPHTPVIMNNIYNPRSIPEFAPCWIDEVDVGGGASRNIPRYVSCMKLKMDELQSNQALAQTLVNSVFSSAQPSGEGYALLSYLGTCNCASSVYTLSPFKDLYFATSFVEARARALREKDAGYSPFDSTAIFFLHTANIFE